jgi:hypothetical protein
MLRISNKYLSLTRNKFWKMMKNMLYDKGRKKDEEHSCINELSYNALRPSWWVVCIIIIIIIITWNKAKSFPAVCPFFFFLPFPTLSGVGTTCFSSYCDKDSEIIFTTDRLPDVNPVVCSYVCLYLYHYTTWWILMREKCLYVYNMHNLKFI